MTEEPLFRIEEEGTNGWFPPEDYDVMMSKEQCRTRYNQLLNDGYSPTRLRIVRDLSLIHI